MSPFRFIHYILFTLHLQENFEGRNHAPLQLFIFLFKRIKIGKMLGNQEKIFLNYTKVCEKNFFAD